MIASLQSALTRDTAAGLSFLHWPGDPAQTPLVLLHGIGSQAESWQAVVTALDAAGAVIAWDAPGYGTSTPLAVAQPRPDDYAASLEMLLQALGYDRIVLVGHSLGCLFAARFAVMHPARVAALGLLSPALGYHVPPGGELPASVQARIDDLDRLGPDSFAAARAARLVFAPDMTPDLVARVRRGMAAVRQPGYSQAAWALGTGNLAADATLITAPTLVGVGTEDVVTPPAGARALYALLDRGLGLHEIGETGHALPQEAPDASARLLRLLLNAADGGR